MATPEYDEDVITDLMNQIFDLHTRLCYFRPGDLVFPHPASPGNETIDGPRHNFSQEDYELFSTLQLSHRVVSLLERLPYLHPEKDGRSFPFYQWGCGLIPPINGNLADARDPIFDTAYPMLPSDMAIVTMNVNDGFTLILDTEANTIRVYARYFDEPIIPEDHNDPRRHAFEYPDVPDHYRNRVPEAAPTFLQRWIHDIKQLNPMPFWESQDSYEGHLLEAPPNFDSTKGIVEDDLVMPPVAGKSKDEISWECRLMQVSILERIVLILRG